MSRAFKILTFQASALVAGALMMGVVADMARAAPIAPAVVTIGNFTFNSPALTVKAGRRLPGPTLTIFLIPSSPRTDSSNRRFWIPATGSRSLSSKLDNSAIIVPCTRT